MAEKKWLKDLPKDGRTGHWGLSVTEKGYMMTDMFLVILEDLDMTLTEQNIQRPVILIVDGASSHISLAMAAYCKEKQIFPWLLKPNTTHLLQPLDLTFFKS